MVYAPEGESQGPEERIETADRQRERERERLEMRRLGGGAEIRRSLR